MRLDLAPLIAQLFGSLIEYVEPPGEWTMSTVVHVNRGQHPIVAIRCQRPLGDRTLIWEMNVTPEFLADYGLADFIACDLERTWQVNSREDER